MEDELNSLSEELRDYVIQREDFSVEKIIAEGGHGKVYFARNKTNQISCALKELNVEAFNDKTIKEYKQEIKVMSLSNNFFVVPFVGFTTKHPYTIITRFIPNGSVYEALHSTDSSKKLTGTQKTIIALGVAAGMAHLHSRGIIHRDLKSLNVLLDSKTYPKICDFGLSHFDTDSSIIDQNTGTPHLMAPELFESKPYTNKVDVYSYGILLYELLTSKIPFNGMTSLQIMNAVCIEKKRPKIPDSAPEKLKFLINLCWSQNPDFRPSFDSIYQLFADHKVGFDQTDFNEVDKLISEFSSMSDKYSNSIAYRYSKDIVNDQNEEDIINYISIIEFGDKDSIEICAKTLPLKQIPNFFEAVRYFLKNTKNEIPILKDLLIIILKMITTNTKNTKAFANSGIIDILPFNSDYYKISFSILEPVIEIYPRTVTEDIIEAIFAFSESDPLKVLRLSKIVSLHFDSLEKTKWFFANELMNRSETFMNTKYSLLYIRILRQIL
ncbi:TKL family protein kinase [Trichomonas vaginalis G3]|uniref:TKL family protein kinase n=1 Tax=Trichomonas vaginalis (strain ATCC PRA-98 / G3) TaxID=412133 RepID=A2F251_TRIV3|nr:protein kinase protein [Trichomonas vaginalis G3]EAY01050.1 TKL family protein kinase [Trichomonas vaginalis G3]KAI5488601.1 protein kinase protein [Trichomonas vaginalis G3]|eukprot:XP_001330088.1 TKL family protein kinase [Trichomonas vaginalis G3]